MTYAKNTRLQSIVLVAFGILLYANTLRHGFVLDDDAVIVRNAFIQRGFDGLLPLLSNDSFAGFERIGGGASLLEGGRYRPLSLVFFTLIYSVFGANPFPFHVFIVGLFALSGLILFKVLGVMMKEMANGALIAFITTMVFLAHPIHTEVVANVKSADEVLALFFGLWAILALFDAYDTGRKMPVVISAVFMLLACLAKENAITFLVTAPLALWYFRKVEPGLVLRYTLPLGLAAAVFLMLREGAIGGQAAGVMMHDPLNNPFLEWNGQAWVPCSLHQKVATILYTFWRYVWLMLFPYPLTHDYYPFHISLQSFTRPEVLGSLILIIAFLYAGIRSTIRKQPEGYGIIFFLITLSLTANIVLTVGTFMAERFLFLPSVGFVFAFVFVLVRLAGKNSVKFIFATAGMITLIFSVMTFSRNQAWKDNESLLRADEKYSANSAKLQNNLGTIILDKALVQADPSTQQDLLREALPHLKKATDLHPTYYDALLAYSACAYYLQLFDQSVKGYRQASVYYPGDAKAKTGLTYALQTYGRDQWIKGDSVPAIATLTEVWTMQPDSATAVQLSSYYQLMGQPDKSKEWQDKAQGGIR